MQIELFDRIKLKSGKSARIVEVYEQGVTYKAEIAVSNGKQITETVAHGDILYVLPEKYVEHTKETLKVSAKSNPSAIAGALVGVLREEGRAEVQAIGAAALNQTIKAIAIARGFVAPSGMDLVCIPAFLVVDLGGEERTAIKLTVEPR